MPNLVRSSIPWLLIALTTLAVFWGGLGGAFLFDDEMNILLNSRVHLSELSLENLQTAMQAYGSGFSSRALATLTVALNYYIGGTDPFGYKLFGLLVHVLNASALYALLRRLLRGRHAHAEAAALMLALAWSLHPLQVSSALYVIQRMETMAAGFTLLALIAYVQAREQQLRGEASRTAWLALGLCALLASLCKETAALIPVFALVIEATLFGFRAQNPALQRALRTLWAAAIVLALAYFFLHVLPKRMDPAAYARRDFTLEERLLSQFRALALYLGQIVLPLPERMPFFYDNFVPSRGWLQPSSTAWTAVFLGGLLAIAGLLWRKRPLAALGILWFFAAHSLTSNVIALELVFEHRNYLALLGPLLVAADFGDALARRVHPGAILAVALAVLATLGGLSALRAHIWGDPVLLHRTHAQINPTSERALLQYSVSLQQELQLDQHPERIGSVLRVLQAAANVPYGGTPFPEVRALLVMGKLGMQPSPAVWQRLRAKLSDNRRRGGYFFAATVLVRDHHGGAVELDPLEMQETCRVILGKRYADSIIQATCGDIILRDGSPDTELAYRLFLSAALREPTDADYHQRLAAALRGHGQPELAERLEKQLATLNQQ